MLFAFDQLQEVFTRVKQGGKIKYNLNFPIKGELKDYCYCLNKELNDLFHSDIIFSNDSIQYPHITLHMGYLRDVNDLSEFINIIDTEIMPKLECFEVKFSHPYQKNNHFTFLDIIDHNHLIECKKETDYALKKIIIPYEYDMIKGIPHISLAYTINNVTKSDVDTFLKQKEVPPTGYIDELAISFCGKHGTCLGLLKVFQLN